MSGKGCLLSMHAASVVNDMHQQKTLVTSGAKASASNTSGGANSSANVSSATSTAATIVGASFTTSSTPAASKPISPPVDEAAGPNGINAVGSGFGGNNKSNKAANNNNNSNNDTTTNTAANNGAKATANSSNRIKLPLPPPGTGIRHNVVASAEIASPSTGVPKGAAAAKASPRGVSDSTHRSAQVKSGSDNKNIKTDRDHEQQQQQSSSSSRPRKATTATGKKKKQRTDPMMEDEEGNDHAQDQMEKCCSDAGSASMSGEDDDHSITSSGSYDSTSGLDDSNSSFTSSSTHSSCSSNSPQHEQRMEEAEAVSPDLEYAVLAHRKKGVLLSRLSEISTRGTLSVIDLARRGLGANDVALIEQVLLGNPMLTVLKLGYNDLGDIGAHCIANALCVERDGKLEHRSLSVLDLSFNEIGDDGCGGLAMKAIAGNYHLRTLFLTGNNIGQKGALSIAGALVHGCYLSRLHLTANKIGPEGIKALATAIAEVDARFQMRDLAAGTGAMTAMGGVLAANAQAHNPFRQRMEHLFLGSTSMESTGFFAIPSMLLSNTSLKVLCLTDNNIDDRDMSILAQALTQNKNIPLESILLSFNQITCAGVEALMNSIWGSPTLKEIKLDNNKMQDRGAQLCAVVLSSIKLEKLDISFNSVTTVGIRALMKSLSEDTNMRSLGICGIPIDLNAAKAVSFALAYNSALETVYMDNCQVGYSAQRHIIAGIVSNQKAPLRYLTGFPMCPICVTLGMPQLPEEWSNEKVLAFVRLMWRNWGKKRDSSGDGKGENEEEAKGPAPPAAVAAAAKIALASLGSNPSAELYVEPRKSEAFSSFETNDNQSALIPSNAALIERTYSGRLQVPSVGGAEGGDQNGFLEAWTESSAFGRPTTVNYHVSGAATQEAPLDNPEQRNRNLRWLRTHFRPLIDVGQLPFNNADMWQLHQYYFSPPYFSDDTDSDSKPTSVEEDDSNAAASPPFGGKSSSKEKVVAPPSTPVSYGSNPGQGINFQALKSAVAAAELTDGSTNKRRGHGEEVADDDEDGRSTKETEPSAKRKKNLKPRIAYYPRIRAKLESLGTKPLEQTLSLLRKLKYVENVIFPEHTAYEELDRLRDSEHATRLDVEMILLDLI